MHLASRCAVSRPIRSPTDLDVGVPPGPVRLLIRDRDQTFTDQLNDMFRSEGIEIVRTPQANGVAERFVRTVRSECLDWLLVLNHAHLERVLEVGVTHDNEHRPIEHCLSHHPSHDVHRSRRRPARFVFTVATVSVVWFTSTSWRRNQVLAPYRALPAISAG